MENNLAAALLPIALLCGCGTPMVWQGPPGTGQQELTATRSECQHKSEAWRSYNDQVYQQTSMQTEVNGQPRAPNELYRTAGQLFDQCMSEHGYKLVPKG
jgi:hypothetical protein